MLDDGTRCVHEEGSVEWCLEYWEDLGEADHDAVVPDEAALCDGRAKSSGSRIPVGRPGPQPWVGPRRNPADCRFRLIGAAARATRLRPERCWKLSLAAKLLVGARTPGSPGDRRPVAPLCSTGVAAIIHATPSRATPQVGASAHSHGVQRTPLPVVVHTGPAARCSRPARIAVRTSSAAKPTRSRRRAVPPPRHTACRPTRQDAPGSDARGARLE